MLKELVIKNFALIDKFQIEFKPGLNFLTGETGAGKSIIINALNLALGSRADFEYIREGHDTATVEALFSLDNRDGLKGMIANFGVEMEGGDLIIKRVVSRSGKNKIFINGSMAPLSVLSQVGFGLADIHGQHQHQALFQTDTHIRFLDAFGKLEDPCAEVQKLEGKYKDLKKQIDTKEEQARERVRKKERIKFEISEIKKAELSPTEEEELSAEIKKLQNSGTLMESANSALNDLYDSDGSMADVIKRINSNLDLSCKIDPCLSPFVETSNSIMIQLEDLASGLREYSKSIEYNQERLSEVEDRYTEIQSLKRKYGSSVKEILDYLGQIESELASLESEEEHFEKIGEEFEEARETLQNKALELAMDREKAAGKFSQLIKKELVDMNMEKVEFLVDFFYEKDSASPFILNKKPVRLNPHGFGKAEFLFSSNPGEKPKPLSKIASGGEISRVMLALKNILPGQEDVPTMVFDEVDSGIGGKVAEKVGEKLKKISKGRQVLCITHLPQIAAMADTHYLISKSFSKDKTKIAIRELTMAERIDEIARMSGGSVITKATRRHAEEMIKKEYIE